MDEFNDYMLDHLDVDIGMCGEFLIINVFFKFFILLIVTVICEMQANLLATHDF